MEELVSVIVPVYNVSKYLERCINSILCQSYENIEVCLVDDGSTDNSGKMCDKYVRKDKRIFAIHKPNGGLSDARNIGIEYVHGAYVCFIDSDDYIHKDMIKALYDMITASKTDIAVCGFKKVAEESTFEEQIHERGAQQVLSFSEIIEKTENNVYLRDVMVVTWNKLYRRDLFRSIEFPVGKCHEDEYTTYKLLASANYISYIEEELYYYVQRDSSIMGNGFSVRSLDKLEALREKAEYINQILPRYYTLFQYEYVRQLMDSIVMGKYNSDIEPTTIGDLKSEFRRYIKLVNVKELSSKRQLKIKVFSLSNYAYYKLLY